MSGGGSEEGTTLEYTPTWVVALLCTVIVAISLGVERLLHFLGKYLKKKQQKPLFAALQKVKEELMLLGFISLLLTVFQGPISKMCISQKYVDNLLPCKPPEAAAEGHGSIATTGSHFQTVFTSSISSKARRLLAESSASETGYCAKKGKVPLLSVEALHHLHIFIFVLAIVHVTFCVLTVLFGGARIRQWKHWEDSIAKETLDTQQVSEKLSVSLSSLLALIVAVLKKKVTHVHQHAFIREHFLGIGKDSALLGWVNSFFKQFYASVTKADYVTLRLGFIMLLNVSVAYPLLPLNINDDFLTDSPNVPLQLVSLDICGRISVAEYKWYATPSTGKLDADFMLGSRVMSSSLSKLVALQEIMEECGIGVDASSSDGAVNVGQHRVLIFAQHKAFLDIIERDLFQTNMKRGSDEFIRDIYEVGYFLVIRFLLVLVLPLLYWALGYLDVTMSSWCYNFLLLNLCICDYVHLKAMDRAHRLGQRKVVNVHRLIMRGTLEEKVMSLQRFKLSVANAVINAENASLKTMNTDQLLDLFASAEVSKKGGRASSRSDVDGDPKLMGTGKGLKAILGGLEELWDQSQYTEEYNLNQF
ncbi:hypothetical protein JRO89_XS04G0098800 [Xanthoceras sorbifolium]|uniref:MLO-like protein n=1 Tax=Xanthoceras sorbifolium TaxID=99658 RepID=A0ABQ8I4P7_9ROSI|nr:hypothetical protein JRO89_XS04G0098800 [Xanthoceras sorbifolium]